MTGAGWTSWGVPFKDPRVIDAIEDPRRHSDFKRSIRLRFLVNGGIAIEDGFRRAGVDPVEAFGARSFRDLNDDLDGSKNPEQYHLWVRSVIAEAAARDFPELVEDGADPEDEGPEAVR